MANTGQGGGTSLPAVATENVTLTDSAYQAAIKAMELGLTITSGFRSEEENAQVGGASNSDHLTGTAFDVAGNQSAMDEFATWAKNSGLFDYTLWQTEGHYDHVHVSWKEDGSKADTTKTGQSSKVGGIAFGFIRLAFIILLLIVGLAFFFGAFPQTEAVNKKAKEAVKKGAKTIGQKS